MSLAELPVAGVLERVVAHLIESESMTTRTLISECGPALREATYAYHVRQLNIEDDDNALYEAEKGIRPSLLNVVLENDSIAQHVDALVVHSPANTDSETLDGEAFERLVSRLSLRHVRWLSSRAPSARVISALAHQHLLDHLVVLPTDRWDGRGMSTLPTSLTRLRIASLSGEGAAQLREALADLPALERLTLEATPYIDDAVLQSIGEHLKRLQHLVIKDMLGTKLTDIGMRALGEVPLVSLCLDNVEGRLTKTCWTQFRPPASLTSLTVRFYEEGVHKSWVADHLGSIHACVHSGMSHFEVTRIISYDKSKTRSDVVRLRPMPDDLIDALVDNGAMWTTLVVDFWTLTLANLKRLFEVVPRVTKLGVVLDDEFKNLVTLTGSAAAARSLRELVVSIPESRIPELVMSPSSSPIVNLASLPGAGGSPEMASGLRPDQEALLPPAKEIKRFFRKTKIERLAWTGHTAVSEWNVTRQGVAGVKVDFVPFVAPAPSQPAQRSASDMLKSPGRSSIMATPSSPSSSPLRPRRVSTMSLSPDPSVASSPSLDSMTYSTSSSESDVASFVRQQQQQQHQAMAGYGLGLGLGLNGMSEMLHSLECSPASAAPPNFITGMTSYRDPFAPSSSYGQHGFGQPQTTSPMMVPPSSPFSYPSPYHYAPPPGFGYGPFSTSTTSASASPTQLGQPIALPEMGSPSSSRRGSAPSFLTSPSPSPTSSTSNAKSRSSAANGHPGSSTNKAYPSMSRSTTTGHHSRQASVGAIGTPSGGQSSSTQTHQSGAGAGNGNGNGSGQGKKKKRDDRRRLGGTNIGYQRGKPRNKTS